MLYFEEESLKRSRIRILHQQTVNRLWEVWPSSLGSSELFLRPTWGIYICSWYMYFGDNNWGFNVLEVKFILINKVSVLSLVCLKSLTLDLSRITYTVCLCRLGLYKYTVSLGRGGLYVTNNNVSILYRYLQSQDIQFRLFGTTECMVK